MVEIHLVYEGNLRLRATHAPSQTVLVTDAPVDNHGKGESFSPTDLVATALGSCMATIIGIVAGRHHLDLTGMSVTVRKHMLQTPVRKIGRLEVDFKIPGKIQEKDRELLKRAAMTCPVHQSLHPDIKMDFNFYWE